METSIVTIANVKVTLRETVQSLIEGAENLTNTIAGKKNNMEKVVEGVTQVHILEVARLLEVVQGVAEVVQGAGVEDAVDAVTEEIVEVEAETDGEASAIADGLIVDAQTAEIEVDRGQGLEIAIVADLQEAETEEEIGQ